MDIRDDLSEFLTSRRAGLTLEKAGLPDFGGRRRVPGLRREEVALLAGMSAEYYKRLERGNATGVSEAVIDGVSRALQLSEAEHSHLYDLVRAANAGAHPHRRRSGKRSHLTAGMRQTIDAMSTVPVFVQNGRLDGGQGAPVLLRKTTNPRYGDALLITGAEGLLILLAGILLTTPIGWVVTGRASLRVAATTYGGGFLIALTVVGILAPHADR